MARSAGAARSGVTAVRRRRARIPRPDVHVGPGLAWPLLGVLPLFVFGMWLLTASTARIALFIAWGDRDGRGRGLETFLQMNPEILREPWYPLVQPLGLTADTVASAALLSMFATFPTGIPERRWQRISVGFLWTPVVVAPLSLLVVPHVLMPEVHRRAAARHPQPVRVPRLAGRARGRLPRRLLLAGGLRSHSRC